MKTSPNTALPTPEPKACIVIVDDEQSILSSLKSLLRRQLYDLHCFDNGFDAVTFITQNAPDIIISDMRMPEMSGMEFLDQAAVLCPTSTRLMLSGYEDRTIIFDAIAHGIAEQFIMKPWDDVELLGLIARVQHTRLELRRMNLDETLRNISSLTSPPQAKQQIQRIMASDARSIRDLATEIDKVPSLVARILRIANSVYYSARVPISTTLEAVTFIGAEYVESLILAMSIFHHGEDKLTKTFSEQLDDVLRHAVHRAILGRSIAGQWPGFKHSAQAYTVCLLLDIGFIVRFNTDVEKGKQLVTLSKSLHQTIHQAEAKIYTIPHTVVGAALLDLWNFPKPLITAIERHHSETHDDVLSQIAQIADVVESGDHFLGHDPLVNPKILEWVNINTSLL